MTVRISADPGLRIEAAVVVDASLVIRPSPFGRKRLGDAVQIEQIRLAVAQSPVPDEVEPQLGRLLISAVLFGALLDRALWHPWLAAITGDGGSCGHVAFALDTDQPRPSSRRWFVDPITKRFLDQFQSNDRAEAAAADPDACASAFLSRCIGISIDLDDLVSQTEAWWRLRMPGLFVGYANQTTTSASVPPPGWRRIETGLAVIVAKRQSKPTASIVGRQGEGPAIAQLRALVRPWSQKKSSASLRQRAVGARAAIDDALEAGQFITSWGEVLARWQSQRLNPTFVLPYQKKVGIGVEWALDQLTRVSALFEYGPPYDGDPDGADLEELYLDFIETGTDMPEAKLRIWAIYSFHKFMEVDAGWPFIEFDIVGMDLRAPADAALISIKDYERAREIVSSGLGPQSKTDQQHLATMRRCILALGFRAGLRMSEVMELTMNDLRHQRGDVELFVRSNKQRTVKSKTSRRLLPLHLFLAPDERDELVAWHQRRTRTLGQTAVPDRLFALGGGGERLDRSDAEDRINRALKTATGDENAIFHHLRHSFASYLLATLSLPEGHEITLPAGLDDTCISQERRTKLLPALTGHGLGRSSLYAVSAMLGHARTPTTLHTYIHLLDWGLAQFLARPEALGDVCPEIVKHRLAPQRLDIEQLPVSEMPPGDENRVPEKIEPTGVVTAEWRGLAHSVTDVRTSEGTIVSPRRFGVDLDDTFAWEGRMNDIARLETQRGSRRHRVLSGPTDSGAGRLNRFYCATKKSPLLHSRHELWPMTIPRIGAESELMDLMWPRHALVETDQDVRQCVMTFLAKLDPVRCDVPLKPGQEAMKFYRSLCALGVPPGWIVGRPQYRGSPDLNPRSRIPRGWDGTAGRMVPGPEQGRGVSRIRLTVLRDGKDVASPENGEASYAWRYAMVLLAATSTIDIESIACPPRSDRTKRRRRLTAAVAS